MNRLIRKERIVCLSLLCWLAVPLVAWAQSEPPGAPIPAPPRTECTLSSATVAFPQNGQTNVPLNARIAFLFNGEEGCFFSEHSIHLSVNGGSTVKSTRRQIRTRDGKMVLLYLKPTENLQPETTYSVLFNDTAHSFTTGTDVLKDDDVNFNMHLLLATITKIEGSSRSTCSITFQLEGSAPQPQAFLHVLGSAEYNQQSFESGQINSVIATTPLGQIALADNTQTIQVNRFDDCNEKEACLYVAYEGADGTWHGPKKSCVKPKVEVSPANVNPVNTGCSVAQVPAQAGWWMLLLLAPLALRRRPQRQHNDA